MKLLLLAAIGLLPAAASAQGGVFYGTPSQSRIAEPEAAQVPRSKRLTEDDVARVTTIRFARCMLQRNRRKIEPALLSQHYNTGRGIDVPNLASSDCLAEGVLKMPYQILRGSYFTVLYREKFGDGPPALPSSSLNFHDGAVEPFTDGQRQWVALRQFADCAARRNPAAAHAAVIAEPGSAADTAAFKALGPSLSACLPSGTTLKFSRAMLSGLFAEVMYRQSLAVTGTALGAAK